MITDDALHNKQESEWQLLLQFVPPDEAGSERQSAQRIAEAVRELGLQPAVVKRIEAAVKEALEVGIRQGRRAQQKPAVAVRVWTSGLPTREALSSGSGIQPVGSQKRGGWGFFLLERHEGDLQVPQVESTRTIDLCLYQESAVTEKKMAAKRLSHPTDHKAIKEE